MAKSSILKAHYLGTIMKQQSTLTICKLITFMSFFFCTELPHLIQAIWFSFTDTSQEVQDLLPSLGSQPHLRQTTALLSTSELQFLQNMALVYLKLR